MGAPMSTVSPGSSRPLHGSTLSHGGQAATSPSACGSGVKGDHGYKRAWLRLEACMARRQARWTTATRSSLRLQACCLATVAGVSRYGCRRASLRLQACGSGWKENCSVVCPTFLSGRVSRAGCPKRTAP